MQNRFERKVPANFKLGISSRGLIWTLRMGLSHPLSMAEKLQKIFYLWQRRLKTEFLAGVGPRGFNLDLVRLPRWVSWPWLHWKPAATHHATSHSYLKFVLQLTRVLPKNIRAPVQNLGDLLCGEKALLLKDPNNDFNILLTHGENFRATVKHPL